MKRITPILGALLLGFGLAWTLKPAQERKAENREGDCSVVIHYPSGDTYKTLDVRVDPIDPTPGQWFVVSSRRVNGKWEQVGPTVTLSPIKEPD